MNSAADIWDRVLSLMEQTMTKTTISTWFSDAEPVALEENRFILCIPTDFKKEIVESRYLPDIKKALYDLFSADLDVVILSQEERGKYTKRDSASRFLPGTEDYTFERFVVGNSNKFAHAAAMAVAERPAESYNPLFIYGESGLGKTHLLYAIAHTIHNAHPDYKIVYIRGDAFTNELIRAIREGKNQEFRDKYRSADVFLMDDVQFIAGRDSTQEEMFHTFNNLYEEKKQIVFTSDRPPKEMLRLEDRLKTRFEWGLIADIQPPDYETRMAIIKNKSVSLGFELPDDVCSFIAENVTSNVRLLEGTVKKIRAYHDLDNMELTVPNVSRAIKDMYNREKAESLPTPSLIIGEVSHFYNIEESVIRGTLKNKNTAEARQVAMYLVRKLTNLSLPDIGKEFGRDHSTVIHSLKKVEQQLAAGTGGLQDNIRDITTNINSKL